MEVKEKWEALTKSQRESMIDQYRDINTSDGIEWWDYTYDTFRERMAAQGISVREIYFSGFWSQGDGACFGGCVSDWGMFLKAVKPDVEESVWKFANAHDLSLAWWHSGHYYHEYSVSYSEELSVENPHDEEEHPLLYDAWEIINGCSGPVADLYDLMAEHLRSEMRQLYSDLEEEYDYLTSDEAITKYILDNLGDEIDHLFSISEDDEEKEEVY